MILFWWFSLCPTYSFSLDVSVDPRQGCVTFHAWHQCFWCPSQLLFRSKRIADDLTRVSMAKNPSLSASLEYIASRHRIRCINLFASPNRKNDIRGLIFILGPSDITTSTLGHFPGSGHGVVAYTFSTSPPHRYYSNNKLYPQINWDLLVCTIRPLPWEWILPVTVHNGKPIYCTQNYLNLWQ